MAAPAALVGGTPPVPRAGTGPAADRWGPGTRVPALLLSPLLPAVSGVDHTSYDTTSILATIERRYGLAPLSKRDQAVADFLPLFRKR